MYLYVAVVVANCPEGAQVAAGVTHDLLQALGVGHVNYLVLRALIEEV